MQNRFPINPELVKALKEKRPRLNDAEIELLVHELEGHIGRSISNGGDVAIVKKNADGSSDLHIIEIDRKS